MSRRTALKTRMANSNPSSKLTGAVNPSWTVKPNRSNRRNPRSIPATNATNTHNEASKRAPNRFMPMNHTSPKLETLTSFIAVWSAIRNFDRGAVTPKLLYCRQFVRENVFPVFKKAPLGRAVPQPRGCFLELRPLLNAMFKAQLAIGTYSTRDSTAAR